MAGLFRPAIYLPDDALEWDEATRRKVIQHESEHLRCRDPLYTCLARVCLALHWVNPLVWWAMARLHRTQELAADEVVLRHDSDRREYAELLLRFAQRNPTRYPLGDLAHPMAQTSTLGTRIENILESRLASKPKGQKALSVLLVAVGILFGMATVVQAANQLNDWLDQNALRGFTKPTAAAKALPTWLGNRGLRGLYNDYCGTFTLAAIEGLLENELYLSGPHKDGAFDVTNRKAFGHYNPAAVRELVDAGDRLLRNKAFVAATRPLYKERMRPLVLAFYKAYVHCYDNPEFEAAKQTYLKHLEGAGVPDIWGGGDALGVRPNA